MVASLVTGKAKPRSFTKLLRPEPDENGLELEERIVFCGIPWSRYLALDKALGDDRPGPRFYYLDGELEIMSTSDEHERLKSWLTGFLEDYVLLLGMEIFTRGQATMRDALKQAGAEPDASWCLVEEKKFPDLVLEIALTSGGVRKLEVYQRFAVPEVWFWQRRKLQMFLLRPDASGYDASPQSRLLSDLDLALLQRCLAIPSWQQARRAFRAGLV